jgi:hypothetical protein
VDHGTGSETEVAVIFERARECLRDAGLGLKDLLGQDPQRRLSGLRNAVVFGRAVTNVLENLRGKVDDFDAWYKPHSSRLGEDQSFRRIYKMRSEILKEGATNVGRSIHINSFDTDDMQRFGQPPPGASGFFMGDERGGSGWLIPLPDGTEEKYYVALPPDIGTTSFVMDIGDRTGVPVGGVLARYLNTLKTLIDEAESTFGGAA